MIDPKPPAEIAWLSDVVGDDATLQLIELRGGTSLYVPRFFDADMELSRSLGAPAARGLVQRFGGSGIRIPLLKWWRARVYAARGMTYAEIALKLGATNVSVWRWLHPDKAPVSQLTLFD